MEFSVTQQSLQTYFSSTDDREAFAQTSLPVSRCQSAFILNTNHLLACSSAQLILQGELFLDDHVNQTHPQWNLNQTETHFLMFTSWKNFHKNVVNSHKFLMLIYLAWGHSEVHDQNNNNNKDLRPLVSHSHHALLPPGSIFTPTLLLLISFHPGHIGCWSGGVEVGGGWIYAPKIYQALVMTMGVSNRMLSV